MANDNRKDIANSLNKYTDYAQKGTNLVLDSADNINKWYEKQLNKITESDVDISRIETGVDNEIDESNNTDNKKEISTKQKQYNEIQTNKGNNKSNIIKSNKIQTTVEKDNEIVEKNETNNDTVLEKNNSILNTSQKISTVIKGAKLINNTSQKIIRTGKDISTGLNENGTTAFKTTSNRIMTKPIKKVGSKVSNKITKETVKYTKKIGTKINRKTSKKVISQTTVVMVRMMKLLVKLVADAVKIILSMLPQIAPVIIIIVIIAAIGDFLNLKNTEEANDINFEEIAELMIIIEDENLQAIYNEFLKNIGKPYLMDHSNLSHTECMEYYDCSSLVIHVLGHTGIKIIPNTRC